MKNLLFYSFALLAMVTFVNNGYSQLVHKSIYFNANENWREDQAQEIFRKYLDIDGIDNVMVLTSNTTTKQGIIVKRYTQYYKGVKVAHGTYTLTCKSGKVVFINGDFYEVTPSTPAVPAISERGALAYALKFVGAEKYIWEDPKEEQRIKAIYHKPDTSFYPKGVLRLIDDHRTTQRDRKVRLAWMFTIYAQQPLSKQEVYVDAMTGKVLFSNPLIKHTAANGATKYSGTVNFVTSDIGPTYELFDSTRGSGVHTLDMNNGTSYGAATEYTSATNTWPVAGDNVALDAHWGAEAVYDYWLSEQGRHSYDDGDGILLQYVHYGTSFNNAFWNGSEMTYGDGSGCSSGFDALVSLDVTAHEIGHGVCQFTSDLVYELESGAMNEAFSDCWGATIEAWAAVGEVDAVAKSTWAMGEEIDCGTPLRRMDFPNLRSDPDTYGGTYWVNQVGCVPDGTNDNCGVHTNSGVMNKWYYIVVNGEAGTNDLSNVYNVTGIGFTDAAKILYQTELVLTPTADYNEMRTESINTATLLFGACSQQVITVTDAWYAVGVGSAYVPFPAYITGVTGICIGGTTLLSNATPGGTWTSTFPGIATVSSGGLVTGIAPGIDTIKYSVGSGCDAKKIVTVNAIPAAAITPFPMASICAGGTTTLTASPAGMNYQWMLGGSNIAGATNLTHTTGVVGNYTVRVTSSIGCTAVSPITAVALSSSPTATITPAGSTTFCIGGNVVLNANPGSGFTYQWLSGGGPISGATSISYTAAVSGSYSVAVTNGAGCSTTSTGTTVTVMPSPGATITPAGPTTFCSPGSVVLNANTGAGFIYQWLLGGVAVSGATTSSFTASSNGSYSVIVTSGPCAATSSVVAVSVMTATPGPITGSPAVCIGFTTPLANSMPGGTWTSSNPSVGVVNSLGVVTGLSAGTTNITYTITNMCGTGFATLTVTVGVGSAITPITGSLSICAGGTTVLANATPGGTWSSSIPAVATIGSSSGVATGVSLGSTTITYSVNASGCISRSFATLNVTSPSAVSITPSGPTSFCSGGSVVLGASTGTGYIYQWKKGGVNIPGAITSTYTATATGNYTVVVSYPGGCSATSAAVAVTVGTSGRPSVAISPSKSALCAGDSVSFTAMPTLGGTAPTYLWYVNGTFIPGVGAVYKYPPTNGDRITVVMTSNYLCADTNKASATYTAMVQPKLPNTITVYATKLGFALGTPDTFIAVAPYPGLTPSYQWRVNGFALAGATNSMYITTALPDNAIVSCELTSSESCVYPRTVHSSGIQVSVWNLEVKADPNTGRKFTLVPNPNKGEFTIEGSLGLMVDGNVAIVMMNALGQTVYNEQVEVPKGRLNKHVVLNNSIVNGTYLVVVSSSAERMIYHVVVDR